MKPCRILLGCMLTSFCLLSDGALAQVVTEFSAGITAGASPTGITAGPDGNLWFAEYSGNQIGRITPFGVVTEFSAGISVGAGPRGITTGPDGNLWFTEVDGNRIGRITPLGVVTEFSLIGGPGSLVPDGITAGPDGNLWFTELDRIGRITPLGVVTEFSAGISVGAGPRGITAGPDGNLWFTEQGADRIGRITPLGVVTEFSAGITAVATPVGITAGPDGNLWFTEAVGNRIARITPLGVVTEFSLIGGPGSLVPVAITAGPDGNLWFTEPGGNRIARITPLGVVAEFSAGITVSAFPDGITAGPDGNLWFTEQKGRIGRITTGPVITAIAVEYYYAAWNYYFVTSFPPEIAALDGGAFGGAWQRTGQTFDVWTQTTGEALPTCRFFTTFFAPKSTHFYTPYPVECAIVMLNPAWQYEANAFYVQLPDVDGICPAGTSTLFRLYNNGMGGAPNHRYTTSFMIFNQMEAAGWIPEGNGATRAFACVP
jgi:streptogramin lyase